MTAFARRMDAEAAARAVIIQVAARHGVSVERIRGSKRDRRTAQIRFEAYHQLQALGLSLPAIGRACGGRNHATVWKGLRSKWFDPELRPVFVQPAELVSAGAGL